jgi:uncharacterized PurR-regulated membrane protein YhhQ (DUF165 family)
MIYFVLFISTIFLANWLIGNVGYNCYPCIIPIGFSLYAPSGVLAVGLGFTLRDLLQRTMGIKWTVIAIVIGALLSYFINPFLALASGSAFLLSELFDLLVYTPLQKRNLTIAVISSNIVGLIVDSFVFLTLAQISLEFLPGQIIGKFWMTLLALPIIWMLRK